MMKQRCTNPNNTQYHDYGGRGIDMDPSWADFGAFLQAMGERPPGTTLDRVDNNKGYWADNCRWASRQEQQRNRRTNRVIEFRGEAKILVDWASALGITPHTLIARLRTWPLEKALTTPAMARGRRSARS